MKKTILTLAILAAAIVTGYSQDKKVDPTHENHYKDIPTIETNELSIDLFDAHSQMGFTLVKAKITNKTSDYIVVKTGEIIFVYEHGSYNPKADMVIIKPKGRKSKTFKVSGDDKFHVKSLSLELKGFYRLPVDGEIQEAPDFQLPASTNDFTAGKYKCNLLKIKQETQETIAQFKCVYNGDNMGLLDPSKLVVKTEDGREYANVIKKSKVKIMQGGDKDKFNAMFKIPGKIVDMQFATMHIVWKDTFMESKLEPLKVAKIDLTFDPGKTAGKN